MSIVYLEKLNKAQALAALFNNAKTQGMGVLHYKPNHVMTEAEAEAVLAEGPYVDYLEGRVIKIDFDKYGENQLDVTQYNRDNGLNAAQDALKIAEDDLGTGGLISKLKIPTRFMGQELQIGDNRSVETALYFYENILGGKLYIIPKYSISYPTLEVDVRYVNDVNLKNKFTMARLDFKRFVEEGLERIISRIIRDFIHVSASARAAPSGARSRASCTS